MSRPSISEEEDDVYLPRRRSERQMARFGRREETVTEAITDKEIERALLSRRPTQEELMKRQRQWVALRSRLERRYHAADDDYEKNLLRDNLAYTASAIHDLGQQIKSDGNEEQKLVERVLSLYDTTGLQLRMVTELKHGVKFGSEVEMLRFELSGESGMASTYIRKGLRVDTFTNGLGFLYDPSKIKIAAAFKRDAWTSPHEEDYAPLFREDKNKFKRTFRGSAGTHVVTDYARYPTARLRGETWQADFPPHTIAALSYKASRTRAYVPGTPKDFEAYNEVVIKPKPGKTLADAIIGVVLVPAKDIDNSSIPEIIQDVRIFLEKPVSVFQYDTMQLKYIPLEVFQKFPFDTPETWKPLREPMTLEAYERQHAQNKALSRLVQHGFAEAFVYDYEDGGYDAVDKTGTLYNFLRFDSTTWKSPSLRTAISTSSKSVTSSAVQALAGIIAAKTYLGVSYDHQEHGEPDVTRTNAATYSYVLDGTVYVVPTNNFRIRLPIIRPERKRAGGVDRIMRLFRKDTVPDHELQRHGNVTRVLVRKFKELAAPYARPDLDPGPEMLYLIASENPKWRDFVL